MWRSRIGNRLPGGGELCTPSLVFSSRPAYSLAEFVPWLWPPSFGTTSDGWSQGRPWGPRRQSDQPTDLGMKFSLCSE